MIESVMKKILVAGGFLLLAALGLAVMDYQKGVREKKGVERAEAEGTRAYKSGLREVGEMEKDLAESQRMQKVLSASAFFRWQEERLQRVKEKKATQLQEEQLKELREIKKKLDR